MILFTTYRYEIERLTRLGDGDKANISNDSHVLRLKASKSGPLNKHAEERENFHAVISTPRAFEEDVPSPILLAKPRSRGRTAIRLRRQKANLHPAPLLISSQPTWELEGSNGSKMPGKSRSSVLDDLGSGGLMRRSRQKADLCSQKKKRPFQMSARKDDLFELDDDDETRVNGHITLALVEPPKKKPAFQMSAPEDDSFETDDDDETQVNECTQGRTPKIDWT
ncbi:hypothetical protein Tco_0890030 [Tanacetum coccineum]